MSFYLSFTQNIKSRKAPNVFYFKDDVLCTRSGNSEPELIKLDKSENPVISALNFINLHNITDSEVLLPSISDAVLDEAFDAISNYLLENDVSIGILTKNKYFREQYSWLLEKYGITYSVPREKPTRCVTGTIKKEKISSKPKLPKEENIETLGSFKTLAPRRLNLEDDLESGLIIDEPFNAKFVKLLNESGKSSVEVYTKGGITRQVFSNILSKKDFIPKKDTVICLIIGMELNYIDAINLLTCAGYALSKSIPQDVVVNKYLKRGIHDLDIINDELDERGCQLLGWKPRDS